MIRTSFASWLGLVVAPFVVLGAQSLNYALVQVACAQRSTLALDVVSAVAFLFSVAATVLAYMRWRLVSHVRDADAAHAAFFALMAMLVAALSALIQLMMWFPQWLISPCR
ncbi:hypothetical protein K788_0004718 [Paraburkholderia caribensis MBA4]|uniref:Uncharacterized protein n=1 Tax=Paraburkholderia caribensis MBA4 TaxID=1323664 RepID=A0A0P0RJZ6_9BURK|nr:hypothetical protein [Paraburkholderia caribensis]ALL69068.1 hypothetical protein K788_0004718 [Paraburkholderia caribensis MBA4]